MPRSKPVPVKKSRSKPKKNSKIVLSDKKARREVSAGGVIYAKRRGQIKIVLVGKFKPFVTWRIPKGHQEKGEKIIETARREVAEESGLKVTGGPKLGCTNFFFVHPVDDKFIHKYVHYFLFKKQGGSVQKHDKEYDKAKWFSIPAAIKAATFKNDKLILKRAAKIIKKRQRAGAARGKDDKKSEVDMGIYQAGCEKD